MKKSFIPLIALLNLLAACAGEISGQLYEDTNQNGVMDLTEQGAGGRLVTITKDGKRFISGYTRPEDGKFSIVTKGPGAYCLLVADAPTAAQGGQAPPAVARQVLDGYAMPGDTSNGGNGSGSGSDTTSAPLAKNCVQVDSYGKSTSFGEIAVPPIDYMADINAMPAPSTCQLKSGESCPVAVAYPCAGKLDQLFLPRWLEGHPETNGITNQFDASLSVMQFAPSPASADTSAPAPGSQSPLCVANFSLQPRADAPHQDLTESLKPRVCFPDGSCRDLPAIPVAYDGKIVFEVQQHYNGTPRLGSDFRLDVTVRNKNVVAVSHVELQVTLPNNVTLLVVSRPDLCNGSTTPVVCHFDFRSGEREKRLAFQVKLPDESAVSGMTRFTFTADADAPDVDPATNELFFELAPPTPAS